MKKLLDLRLRVGLFRFTLLPLEPLFVPAVNKSNMLRGGFGHVFRRLCCIPQCKEAKSCPLAASCPYKIIFEPSPPSGAERLSKNQDIPRPFVFRAPQTQQTRFDKDERFQFDLILIGRALDFLPYFVLSFRELASEGLGLNRARCILQEVRELKLGCNGAGDPLGADTGARLSTRTANPPVSDTQDPFDRGWLGAHASCVHSDNPDTFDGGDPPCTTDPQSEIHDHQVTLAASTVVYSDKDHLFHATSSTDAAHWIETRLRSLSVPAIPATKSYGLGRERLNLALGKIFRLRLGAGDAQMNAGEQVSYRLKPAQGFLDEARQDLQLQRWRSAVDNAQLCTENAVKADVSYVGKRGSFLQFVGIYRQENLNSEFTQPIDGKEWKLPERCHVVPLDDFGSEAGLETLSSFTSNRPKRDKHRRFVETVIPVGLVNTGPGVEVNEELRELTRVVSFVSLVVKKPERTLRTQR